MEIVQGILSELGEYLVELTVNQGRYLICFKSIVEDLGEEESNLKLAQDQMEQRIKKAERNTEIIKKEAEKWRNDTRKIMAEVQRLKDEIEVKKNSLNGWCPNWGCRYSLSRKAVKKMRIMKNLRDSSNNFDGVGHPASLPGLEFSAPKYFDFFQSSIAAFDQIIEALGKDETSLIGLYGMGGSGKTSLAIKLGIKVQKDEIFEEVVMVVVSKTPNFKEIQSKLARALDVELNEEDEEERARRLYLRFTRTNRENNAGTKKIFVILDDVWENFDLKSKIGFPFEEVNNYCKILLTTRKKYVCTDIGCQLRISLELLDKNEGLSLLKRHAGLNDNSSISEELATKVAEECQGLPLAIATVGSALKGKSIYEWNLVLKKLEEAKLDEIYKAIDVDCDRAVYPHLKLSYDYLRDEKTKLWFLLCSLFPEDYRIHVEELIPYGIWLDLFPGTHSFEGLKAELHVKLNILKASCLLLDENEECVKMHDVIRDVARWITTTGDMEFMTKFDKELKDWLSEKGWERCPKLKILLLSGIKGQNMLKIPDECFKELKALKVLILQFVDVSIKSLESLINLKVLQLFDCTLRDISYLEKFNKLEVICHQSSADFHRSEETIPSMLILRESTLGRLPSLTCFFPQNYLSAWETLEVLKISKCPNLTTFFISEVKMHDQKLGVLSLQSLTQVYVGECHKLKNLFSSTHTPNLLQLRELTIEECKELEQIIFKEDADGVDAMNGKETVLLPALKKLSLKALPRLTSFCPAAYQLILNLETLSMEGFQDEQMCVRIMSCLRDVKELNITYCGLKEIQGLSKSLAHNLQNLTTLHVWGCSKLRHIVVPNLLQLKDLTIVACEELEEINIVQVEDEENHVQPVLLHTAAADDDDDVRYHKMPQLECLWLQNLVSLAKFCPVNYHFIFPSLQRLIVEGCPKIEMRFSYCRGENENGSVHAEGEPPKDDNHAPPQIWCDDTDDLRTNLPPYKEKRTSRGSPSGRE